MRSKELVEHWFKIWEVGNFQDMPVSDDFVHVSPYGSISPKSTYMQLVNDNLDKFLGHRFEIHDAIYEENKACVQYSAIKDDFRLEVTEWHYIKDDLICKIVAYYNIEGEISEDRQLKIL